MHRWFKKAKRLIFDTSHIPKKTFSSKLLAPSQEHAITLLNISQSLGVLNDNIYKLVMIFFLIDLEGEQYAARILSAAGAVYVVPFLLFSSYAGVLADRHSKRTIFITVKIAEVLSFAAAMAAFLLKSSPTCFALLFLLSIQAAFFGPSKYGVIAELVERERVPKASSLITSFTFLAIIAGTFLASFLTDISSHRYWIPLTFCLITAVIGFFAAIKIPHTEPQGSLDTSNPFFLVDIFRTLRFSLTRPRLLIAILGTSYFLGIGAFTQLNIIPYAIQALKLNEVAGGYLFLATAIGIALGSLLAGKGCRRRPELGISCLAGYAIALAFFALWIFSSSLTIDIISLIVIGVAGGLFIVPLEAHQQLASPDEKRGQVIAAANFVGFSAVLGASGAIYFFSDVLGLSSAAGFGWMGVATLLATMILCLRLSHLLLHFLARKWVQIKGVSIPTELPSPEEGRAVILLEQANHTSAFALFALYPELHLLVPETERAPPRLIQRLCFSLEWLPPTVSRSDLSERLTELLQEGKTPVLYLDPEENFNLFAIPEEAAPLLESFHCYHAKLEKRGRKLAITLSR